LSKGQWVKFGGKNLKRLEGLAMSDVRRIGDRLRECVKEKSNDRQQENREKKKTT